MAEVLGVAMQDLSRFLCPLPTWGCGRPCCPVATGPPRGLGEQQMESLKVGINLMKTGEDLDLDGYPRRVC